MIFLGLTGSAWFMRGAVQTRVGSGVQSERGGARNQAVFLFLVLLCCCSDGIVRWVKKKTGPPAADMADKAALTAAEKEAEVIVLGYFTEAKVCRGLAQDACKLVWLCASVAPELHSVGCAASCWCVAAWHKAHLHTTRC